MLEKPQYQRLVVGTIVDEKPVLHGRVSGALSTIPYGEPTWLTQGYYSPYYKEASYKSIKAYYYSSLLLYRAIRSFRRRCVSLQTIFCIPMDKQENWTASLHRKLYSIRWRASSFATAVHINNCLIIYTFIQRSQPTCYAYGSWKASQRPHAYEWNS